MLIEHYRRYHNLNLYAKIYQIIENTLKIVPLLPELNEAGLERGVFETLKRAYKEGV